MKEFRLEVDTNTKYMKIIRGFGKIGLGVLIGLAIARLKAGQPFEWNMIIGFLNAGFLAFFPGKAMNGQALIINEEGIFTKGYSFHFRERTKMRWDDIRSIQVADSWFFGTAKIRIINTSGASETIPIPLHTKPQIEDLKSYLKDASTSKNINLQV